VLSFADLLWVTRANVRYGVSDKVFVLGQELIGPIVSRLATMPVFVLAAQLCPDNVEVRLPPPTPPYPSCCIDGLTYLLNESSPECFFAQGHHVLLYTPHPVAGCAHIVLSVAGDCICIHTA